MLNLYCVSFSFSSIRNTISKRVVASYFFFVILIDHFPSYVVRYTYMDQCFSNLKTMDFTFLFYSCSLFACFCFSYQL